MHLPVGLLLLSLSGVFSQRGGSACDESSCYPATGDLLIGREDQLTASSTCGFRSPSRYCIVSHLEDSKKCFYCDSRQKWSETTNRRSHRVENIVHDFNVARRLKWWQAENGKEDVYIQLDLEAEFHFTHMVMTFKTFRPAAMLIEKSSDFGRTWKTYRYFAYDCARYFPGIPTGPIRQLGDVICTDRYSDVAPSTRGEVIFRVLPPFIQIDNPYSEAVQDLLKVTNLRVNFTKLHTLGDNQLDSRPAIKEKYYYSIYEMVVRGSCSCYGHASRCLPLEWQQEKEQMVYGRCECTHNTKGLNCEQCEDFYNNLPWRPARGSETNACERCDCNNHSTRCHFDPAVYASNNNTNGGVCDDCRHNTMGIHCEECKPFYFRDPGRPINDPNVCQPCDCDPYGSEHNGECESRTDEENDLVAGRCICKRYVSGPRCDRCENGYWNLTGDNPAGCQPCACNTLGTIGNYGCDKRTGECRCKRFVTGRACDQCMPNYYGLSEELDGCLACNCDVGGAYDDDCDQQSGQCKCKPHIVNRRCDAPENRYFVPYLDYYIFEAEFERLIGNGHVVVRGPIPNRPTTWTGPGFMKVREGDRLEFQVSGLPTSMDYDILIRYEPQMRERWDDVRVTVIRPDDVDETGVCANSIPQDDTKVAQLLPESRYLVLSPSSCLEKGQNYTIRLDFTRFKSDRLTPDASILIDSIVLIPHTDSVPFFKGSYLAERRRREYLYYRCRELQLGVVKPQIPDICKGYIFSISAWMQGRALYCDCDPMGSTMADCDPIGGKCTCKPNVIGRRCDQCAPGTFGFGPEGCVKCDCHPSGSRDQFCNVLTGECLCRDNAYGRQCDECERGYYGFPNCRPCQCNGRAQECDSRTGECKDCEDNTVGFSCDRCQRGYYGDGGRGVQLRCRECLCPGGNRSGIQHADTCELDLRTNIVMCHCKQGYKPPSCDRCDENYFGNPTVRGGECKLCTCNNNIDPDVPGSCDPDTGECLKCLFNTEGFNCERCKPGYYGDALEQNCQACVCNLLGTNGTAGPCNRRTGQCPCLPNVEGLRCDRCAENHWKIASGEGCEACNCDPDGSLSPRCNEFDGQCQCKIGRGGRTCSECETNYWGDPNDQCYPCECNPQGSASQQCNRVTGKCECMPGVTGDKCDRCDRGTTGELPHCKPCGECFDNWDKIIMDLKNETYHWVREGSKIKIEGAPGAFDKELTTMEEMLEEVKRIISGTNVTSTDVEILKTRITEIRKRLQVQITQTDNIDTDIDEVNKQTGSTRTKIELLITRLVQLKKQAEELRHNATNIQETDISGAYNITVKAQMRSREAQKKVDASSTVIQESENVRQETESLLAENKDEFNDKHNNNRNTLTNIEVDINTISGSIVDINEMVCDKRGDPCDSVCGGGGCGKCGGIGCGDGSVNKAQDAVELAKRNEDQLSAKAGNATELLKDIRDAQEHIDKAKSDASMALDRATDAKNQSFTAKQELEDLIKRIQDFLSEDRAKPASIRAIANKVLNMSISRTPEEINELAIEINKTIENLSNIEGILNSTREDKETAENLKNRADKAKNDADEILNTAQKVIELLDQATKTMTDAENAIETANNNIKDAEDDLTMIESQTKTTKEAANSTLIQTKELEERVKKLTKDFTKNKYELDKATKEVGSAEEQANNAEEVANDLKTRYDNVKVQVDTKYNETMIAKEKAQSIKDRAEKLYRSTKEKVDNLRRMEEEFTENEKTMIDISGEIDKLTKEMEGLVVDIREASKLHRDC